MPARIAHLSDIHFGAEDPLCVAGTLAWLNRLRGDGHRILAIPGNHDVPLYDVAQRFAAPLRRYKKYISNDLCPWFEDEHVAVLGINTARSLTFKDGRINRDQMALIEDRFGR